MLVVPRSTATPRGPLTSWTIPGSGPASGQPEGGKPSARDALPFGGRGRMENFQLKILLGPQLTGQAHPLGQTLRGDMETFAQVRLSRPAGQQANLTKTAGAVPPAGSAYLIACLFQDIPQRKPGLEREAAFLLADDNGELRHTIIPAGAPRLPWRPRSPAWPPVESRNRKTG